MLKPSVCCWKSIAIIWTPIELPLFLGVAPLARLKEKTSEALKGVEPGRTTPNKGWFANPIPLMLNNVE